MRLYYISFVKKQVNVQVISEEDKKRLTRHRSSSDSNVAAIKIVDEFVCSKSVPYAVRTRYEINKLVLMCPQIIGGCG